MIQAIGQTTIMDIKLLHGGLFWNRQAQKNWFRGTSGAEKSIPFTN